MNTPPNLTVRQVAHILNVSQSTVRRLIANGDLEAFKVRRCVRVSRVSVRRFLSSNRYQDIVRKKASSRRSISRLFRR